MSENIDYYNQKYSSTEQTSILQYMRNKSDLEDREKHEAMKNDVIEHIWQIYGHNYLYILKLRLINVLLSIFQCIFHFMFSILIQVIFLVLIFYLVSMLLFSIHIFFYKMKIKNSVLISNNCT